MAYKEGIDLVDDERASIYDLRQIYAIQIVGRTLQNIQIARTTENYSLWYHLLKRDLFTEISKNLKIKEIEHINEKIIETKKVIAENKSAYIKASKNPEEHEKIEDALCELEMLMSRYMQKNKMFGGKEEAELM